jgi:phage baseplate assembly protein V
LKSKRDWCFVTDHRKNFSLTEAHRKIANMVMIGTVIDVDALSGRARVQIGELQTAKLPWLSPRMGNRRDWNPPKGGEQVLVLCHNGDPAQGLIVASLGYDANPNPSSNPQIFKTVYSDGTFVQVDLDTHEMSIGCAGAVTVTAAGNVTVMSAGSIKATAAVKAEVTAPAISLTGPVTITGAVTITGPLTVTGLAALATATVGGVTLQSPNNLF